MRILAAPVLSLLCAAAAWAAPTQWRLELVRESLSGSHCRMRLLADGALTDEYVTLPCTPELTRVAPVPPTDALRRVAGRTARRTIVEPRPLQRFAVDVDAQTGVELRRVPLFYQARQAAVFDPNPVASLNAPGLQDQNDSAGAVPPSAYKLVDLERAEPEGPLRGPYATMVNRQAPDVAPPDAAGSLVFDREAEGFEDVNAWFHIDRNQAYVRSLGFTGSRAIAPYSIEVDAHALAGADNSMFLPSLTNYGTGTLYFGTGGTDDAEDADLVVHEYGHALLEWIAPGTFGGGYASQPRALAEGFCDYWAYSAHRAVRVASGRDPYCIADWDARCWLDASSENCAYAPGTDCLRRVDGGRTMAEYVSTDSPGTEHLNGSIWSSALREIQESLQDAHGPDAGKRLADTIVLESVFGAPPAPGFAAMGNQLLQADRLLYGGAHQAAICSALASRGIVVSCDGRPRGELTLFPGAPRGLPIPDNDPAGVVSSVTVSDSRAIERVLVRVDVEHPVRGDLRIELVAPDGTAVLLEQVSVDRDSGVHATFGLDAAPVQPLEILRGRSLPGAWRLRVSDLRFRDTGSLSSWGLFIQFAGDVPLSGRPRAAHTSMIPVVAHTYGASDTTFRSDVRIANPGARDETAVLLFTPSGADGTTAFAAVRLEVRAGQTAALEDVVESVFGARGAGSLEILGDVIADSRTYEAGPRGTLSQGIPPVEETTRAGGEPLYVIGLEEAGLRYNFGVTEVGGSAGVVRFDLPSGPVDVAVQPFSNVQLRLPEGSARISVVSGAAVVGGYLSEVDPAGDAMYLTAERLRGRTALAPAASAPGVDGTWWRSDFWSAVPIVAFPFIADFYYRTDGEVVEPAEALGGVNYDVVATSFMRPGTVGAIVASLPPELVAHTRITGAGTTQYVPFLDPDGPERQHLLFVENGGAWRTNVGFVSAGPALAEITIFDASGALVESGVLGGEGGLAQRPVTVAVSGGRAEVRFISGQGRAYSSVVDGRTKDATMFVSR